MAPGMSLSAMVFIHNDKLFVIIEFDKSFVNMVKFADRRKPVVRKKGEAFAELVFEVAAYFFRIRTAGQKYGLVSKSGSGTLGFLRTIATAGAITVPDLARMRPTSRQRMQQLADELAAEGLIEFIDNPLHKKSKLMRLTRKGRARYQLMLKQLHEIGAEVAQGVAESELRRAAAIIHALWERTPVD
jgi:DNA-binding MarR family transcriptional regulator